MHPFKAAVSFYGGGIAAFSPGGGKPTVERSGEIQGRILCLFGADDAMIPPTQVETIRRALEQHQVKHEIVVYPGAGHAFFCEVPERKSYNAAAAEDAWKRVKQLFADELR
jgi:carboxymethylenebutenolidase